ncbi:MAG: hypothetical protein R3B09_30395 [Nannocystaceae bacterium]
MLPACEPDLEVHEGEHLRYEHAPEDRPCAGTPRALDALVPLLAETYHRPPPSSLRYTWYAEADGLSPCSAGGCVRGSRAFAAVPFDVHELVHLVYGSGSSPFFTEGVAVALASFPLHDRNAPLRSPLDRITEVGDPRPTMGADRASAVDLEAAGAFVAFLLAWHGPDKLSRLFDRVGPDGSMTRAREVFREVYGVELDDEAERFLDGAPCPDDPFPLLSYACLGETLTDVDGRWTLETELQCEGDDSVLGGVDDSDARGTHFARAVTLEIPADGEYVLRVPDDPATSVRLGPCFGCPWRGGDLLLEGGPPAVAPYLRAGRHYLIVHAPGPTGIGGAVTLEALPVP